jgi:hypothetical protein
VDRQLAGVKLKFTDKYRISVADPEPTSDAFRRSRHEANGAFCAAAPEALDNDHAATPTWLLTQRQTIARHALVAAVRSILNLSGDFVVRVSQRLMCCIAPSLGVFGEAVEFAL